MLLTKMVTKSMPNQLSSSNFYIQKMLEDPLILHTV